MSSNSTLPICLADPGWMRIDEAALRVSGAVDVIVREMESVLSDESVRSMCKHLGILSGGFLFRDELRKLTRFFSEDLNDEPKTYRTDYIWFNSEAEKWTDLVHSIFVHVRTSQYNYSKKMNMRMEDYFRYIPKDYGLDCCIAKEEQQLRRIHSVHYVSLGEMLFTLLVWRHIAAGVALHGPNFPLDQLNIDLDVEDERLGAWSWDGVDLLHPGSLGADLQWLDELAEAWKTLYSGKPSLRMEWGLLGLRREVPPGDAAIENFALHKFASTIGAIQESPEQGTVSDEALWAAIQGSTANLLQILGVARDVSTVGDALQTIERYARFPLLPFYAWHALDGAPKCYLVSPVWTSQQHAVTVDHIDCRHLGLALCAVAPLRRIDWTLPPKFSPSDAPHLSDADPAVLANILRLMARPLVEGLLYSRVVDEVRAHLADEADDAVNKTVRETH